MPRKMIIKKDGKPYSLTQVVTGDEEELQELVKDNPDIFGKIEKQLREKLNLVSSNNKKSD